MTKHVFTFGAPDGAALPHFNQDGVTHHTLILGASGSGKSAFLQELALRRGVPYEQLLREVQPTAEQVDRARERREERNTMDTKRLDAVRRAWWDATPADDTELYALSDVLTSQIPELADPTHEQQRVVFMMLPDVIIGGVIQWGLSDTEVRDQVYVFVRDHLAEVRQTMGLSPA
ncbi:hypothetical protein [Rhodanobacter sp. FW106-PBR-LB-2-11]|uniref:hypothetical protein n=1 Tax=Rhodanobacter sp. FW106-PBR-LB-2-11 TaxID=1524463 RepID=UPI0034E50317